MNESRREHDKRIGRCARRWIAAMLVLCLTPLALFAAGESLRWRFMASPLERLSGHLLDRGVSFGDPADRNRFQLSLLHGVALRLAALRIGGGASAAVPMVDADDLSLHMSYRDLLSFRPGQALPVEMLSTRHLGLHLARDPAGRGNWVFGERKAPTPDSRPFIQGVRFARLHIRDGEFSYRDAPLALDLAGRFAYADGTALAGGDAGLRGSATGRYRAQPLSATLHSGPLLAAFAGDAPDATLFLKLAASSGHARLGLDGQIRGLPGAIRVDTAFTVSGPSLAQLGAPLGVTLPVTPPFAMKGRLLREGLLWKVAVERASIGRSELGGDFVFRQAEAGRRGRLDGRLRGKALWLADLGPAVGTAGAGAGGDPRPVTAAPGGRVLPDRQFDVPALRAMDADVRIALDRLELGTPALEDIRPLQARLLLDAGRLALEDLDATLARGHVRGRIELDAARQPPRWRTALAFNGVALEDWIRPADKTRRLTGRLEGRIELTGAGRSTAAILAEANGEARLGIREGRISHLLLELAGLDVAQSLGVLAAGDELLPIRCGVAALKFDRGMVRPELFVLDTRDSVFRVGGAASLATERLDLVARVTPRDVSPLALRTPLRIRGSFAEPSVRLEAAPLVTRLGAAAALATVNPLAGLLPLIDPGRGFGADAAAARQDADVCLALTGGQTPPMVAVGQD